MKLLKTNIRYYLSLKYIPPIIAAGMVLVGVIIFYGNAAIMGNMIVLATVVGTVPYVILSYLEFQKIKAIEEEIPNFLLDLSESLKTGMSLPDGIRQGARTDYGKLTPEIKKISDQMSWGLPLQDAMENFSRRLRNSKMVGRVVRIVNEAYSSGGDVARTMEATATDMLSIREAERERSSMVKQHVISMYFIYFIFIGIIVGLSKTLVQMLNVNTGPTPFGGAFGFSDPCSTCSSNPTAYCIGCAVFGVVGLMFGLGTGAIAYYNALFLVMIVIQGIFSGIVAGQIGEGSVTAGFKHSAIMTTSGFATLLILLRSGLL